MSQILGMALPFFALIFLGFAAAKIKNLPLEGLAWMNFFIIYVALPALLFNLLYRTPVEELANWSFIFFALLGTYCTFAIAFCVGIYVTDGDIPESTIHGLSGAYGNIGYMGPGLALVALGPGAAVPVALIICFDNTLHFILAPLLMSVGGQKKYKGVIRNVFDVLMQIFTHPFILATILGIAAAVLEVRPPELIVNILENLSKAAAPSALFAMGVTVAINSGGKLPKVVGVLVPIKLLVHPAIVYILLSLGGDFDPVWVYSAVLMASLPCATNVFVMAQQYNVWVSRASTMVLATTLGSVFTVTAVLYIIGTGLLPADLFPGS